MSLTPTVLLPVLDQVVGFMEDALGLQESQRVKLAELSQRNQVLEADKVRLEKVASSLIPLDATQLQQTLIKLAAMGVIDGRYREDLETKFLEDPNVLLPFVIKVAEILRSSSDQGRGISSEDPLPVNDPDGWGDFLAGRAVKLRR